jgi:hypothetical protein
MSDREWQEVRDKRKEFRKGRKGKFPGGVGTSPQGKNYVKIGASSTCKKETPHGDRIYKNNEKQ